MVDRDDDDATSYLDWTHASRRVHRHRLIALTTHHMDDASPRSSQKGPRHACMHALVTLLARAAWRQAQKANNGGGQGGAADRSHPHIPPHHRKAQPDCWQWSGEVVWPMICCGNAGRQYIKYLGAALLLLICCLTAASGGWTRYDMSASRAARGIGTRQVTPGSSIIGHQFSTILNH